MRPLHNISVHSLPAFEAGGLNQQDNLQEILPCISNSDDVTAKTYSSYCLRSFFRN